LGYGSVPICRRGDDQKGKKRIRMKVRSRWNTAGKRGAELEDSLRTRCGKKKEHSGRGGGEHVHLGGTDVRERAVQKTGKEKKDRLK